MLAISKSSLKLMFTRFSGEDLLFFIIFSHLQASSAVMIRITEEEGSKISTPKNFLFCFDDHDQ